jgi:hypothetical protein
VFPHEYRRALDAGESVGHAVDLSLPPGMGQPAEAMQPAGD